MVAAMRAHAGSAGVQEQACRALLNLACNADNSSIAAAGGIEAVVAAMRAHAGSAVQVQACRALLSLASNNADNSLPSPRRAGSRPLSLLRKHAGSAGVQEQACPALAT